MNFYQRYISNSPEWKHKRLARIKYDGFKCRTCWETEDLEVHHLTYVHLGNEPLEDLITLCTHCHEAITSSIRERRFKNRTIAFETQAARETWQQEKAEELKLKFDNESRSNVNYVETTRSKIEFGVTPDYAQWPTGRSPQSDSQGSEKDIGETEEN